MKETQKKTHPKRVDSFVKGLIEKLFLDCEYPIPYRFEKRNLVKVVSEVLSEKNYLLVKLDKKRRK